MNQKELKAILDYDPDTGVFTWKQGKGLTGRRAGTFKDSHRRIIVSGRVYYEHRLAWLFMTGEWPTEQIDHVNRDGADNRWRNLRAATNQENCFNKSVMGRTSRWRGVSWYKRDNKWRAHIMVDGRQLHLGYFDQEENAALAWNFAALEHFGEFAAFNTRRGDEV